jgi:hypothetical protein
MKKTLFNTTVSIINNDITNCFKYDFHCQNKLYNNIYNLNKSDDDIINNYISCKLYNILKGASAEMQFYLDIMKYKNVIVKDYNLNKIDNFKNILKNTIKKYFKKFVFFGYYITPTYLPKNIKAEKYKHFYIINFSNDIKDILNNFKNVNNDIKDILNKLNKEQKNNLYMSDFKINDFFIDVKSNYLKYSWGRFPENKLIAAYENKNKYNIDDIINYILNNHLSLINEIKQFINIKYFKYFIREQKK